MAGADQPPRLVVVSNRLPVAVESRPEGRLAVGLSSGGLVSALEPVLRRRGGLWVGWPGHVRDPDVDLGRELAGSGVMQGFDVVPVELGAADVAGFYDGFSNQVAWPLFHDLFTHCNFDPRYWGVYRRVNDLFAEVVARCLRPGDLVWVHDYHLMCVGAALRARGVRHRIGFFDHIPFPGPDIMRRLPWRETILDALQCFDLLGFQTAADAAHFEDCLRDLPAPHRPAPGGGPRARSFPISIDFEAFEATARAPAVVAAADRLRVDFGERAVILGVDRLDYSKGIPNKFSAFRYALEQYPELRGRVTLVQFVVPSREDVPEYQQLRARLEGMVGAINGDLTESGWVPIHYHYDTLDRETLCAWYRMADVCLVTSLKDGMNLVSKEYCAAQVDRRGVLVLSEFAGSAGELGDAALMVNPYDVAQTADAIRAAFTMPLEERAARMGRLREHVRLHNVFHWVDDFVAALRSVPCAARTGGSAASA